MSGTDRHTEESFDSRLRRVLRSQALAAPMPPAVAEIPDAWTRQRRGIPLAVSAKVVAVSAAAVLAVVLVAQLPRIGALRAHPVAAAAAASFLDVPRAQVVETEDGAVALRRTAAPEPSVELILVTREESGLSAHLLAQIALPEPVPNGVSIWAEPISCSSRLRLQQPNMIVGGSDPPAADIRVGLRQIPSHNGLFLAVLQRGISATGAVTVEFSDFRGIVERSAVTLPASSFDGRDWCTGELIEP